MKLLHIILALLTFSACNFSNNNSFHQIEINKNWKFKQTDKTEWLSATVPGTVHTDLMDNKIIEDPFYRLNEKKIQWIDKKDWEYKTSFNIDENTLNKDKVELNFKGLDTYADVYLNDSLILQADNMFREWIIDCKKHLKLGQNTLHIVLHSPTKKGLELLKANGMPLPASNDQSQNGEMGDDKVSVFTRKAGYHYGWDWGPRIVCSGIWRPIILQSWNKAKIKSVYHAQTKVTKKVANISTIVEIPAIAKENFRLKILINDSLSAEKEIVLAKGNNNINLSFSIKNPKLWWSNGIGESYLYKFETQLWNANEMIQSDIKKIGIRSLKLVQKPDKESNGKSFYFELNGVPVFSKGANYIPQDIFLPRVSPEKYEKIIQDAASSNMNMLRVWGGGIYENNLFYDLCDKYGIMVWQDFMFACSMYPGDEAFLNNVKKEAIDNIKRLRNHACIALWCGNNEIETAWGQYEENAGWGWKQRYTIEQRSKIWKDYEKIFHTILPQAVKKFTYNANYWHSSPSAGMGKLSKSNSNSGDMHYWGVWHAKAPFEDFQKNRARFMSEYGFQSFPEFKSVQKYTLPKDYDIESKVMASHQRSGIGNLRIKSYMDLYFQFSGNFEQFLYVGQVLQARGIREAIEAHRRDRPYCMGSIYWQLDDCWPVASWSSIDYYGRWKALQYHVKKAFENTILSVKENKDSFQVFIISDELTLKNTQTLSLKVIDFEGNEIWKHEQSIEVPTNGTKIAFEGTLSKIKFIIGKQVLVMTLLKENGEQTTQNLHYFTSPKNIKLPKPQIIIRTGHDDRNYAMIKSNYLIKNLFLSIKNDEGQFEDNYFDVLPGKEYKIYYSGQIDNSKFNSGLQYIHLQQTIAKP